mmetsp:Transcript_29863/g.69118  ORF Transcript_29863/g.69118 Transcript_29863/m.69118 type:complete len:83 (+) Transcript_29863:17-265(+)
MGFGRCWQSRCVVRGARQPAEGAFLATSLEDAVLHDSVVGGGVELTDAESRFSGVEDGATSGTAATPKLSAGAGPEASGNFH